jgi:hypothetical protein
MRLLAHAHKHSGVPWLHVKEPTPDANQICWPDVVSQPRASKLYHRGVGMQPPAQASAMSSCQRVALTAICCRYTVHAGHNRTIALNCGHAALTAPTIVTVVWSSAWDNP